MDTQIELYQEIKSKVTTLYQQLQLRKLEKTTGRKLAIPITDTITLSLFKQANHIATKMSIFNIFRPHCTYKTLVVNMNRFALLALIILQRILRWNREGAHLVKHTDATDIPVCLPKNAQHHRTMAGLAGWGHSGKGLFYGIKLHITTDLKRRILAVKFTSGDVHESKVFPDLNKDLLGLFIADAAYVGKQLAREFFIEGARILMAAPRKSMKKLLTAGQLWLYRTRMLIELNFRSLKLFYGLITSLPRSVSGYLANYTYSLLAYLVV